MAIRVRKDGTMWCAALTEPMDGDTYIDDALHYEMSAVHGVIVALLHEEHQKHPQWWWVMSAPASADNWKRRISSDGMCPCQNRPPSSAMPSASETPIAPKPRK